MPAKNSVKQFIENGYYHMYNRSVEKRNIFLDEQDYSVFLGLLKKYLSNTGSDPKTYNYSSYRHYLGIKSASWVKPEEILEYFKTAERIGPNDYFSYESFVEDYRIDSTEVLRELTLE